MCSLRYLPSRQVPAVPKDWIGTCLSPSSEVLPGWQAYRTTPQRPWPAQPLKYRRYCMDPANCGLVASHDVAPPLRARRIITMRVLWFLTKPVCCLALCAGLAGADSIQFRNGRHLQGKYVGGTTTAIGFMTAGTVEYFATSDVLALIFDNNDSPLSGLQPNPMRGKSLPQPRVRRINAATRDRSRQPRIRMAVASMSPM